tara:strand:+ start:1032 stop:1733 length:702 start_codon:yes stop_codon:yes gene_type:complete
MILFLFGAIYFSSFFIPQDMPVLYGVSCEILVILLCYGNFSKTPYTKPAQKSGWFCMTTWTLCNLVLFTWFGEVCVINTAIFVVEAFFFLLMFTYSQFRSYEFKGDEYSDGGCFIVFKRPRSFFDFLHSFIFRPISTVSVIAEGWWFGYTLGSPYHCEMYNCNDDDILIRINYLNGSFVRDCLVPLIGSRWSPLNNCCHAVQRLFPTLKFKMLDSLPSHLIKTLDGERSDGKR